MRFAESHVHPKLMGTINCNPSFGCTQTPKCRNVEFADRFLFIFGFFCLKQCRFIVFRSLLIIFSTPIVRVTLSSLTLCLLFPRRAQFNEAARQHTERNPHCSDKKAALRRLLKGNVALVVVLEELEGAAPSASSAPVAAAAAVAQVCARHPL